VYLRNLFFLSLLACGSIIQAADEENRFAIKGIGLSTCASFVEARKAQSHQYFQFGGWMNGYLSATNRYEKNTFDVVSWQSTGVLAASLAGFCERNPEVQFVRAVVFLINTLGQDRLQNHSELIEAKVGEASVVIYRATLQRAQERLVELHHLDGSPSGEFDAPTQQAFRRFQEEAALEVSGLPDQLTLAKLFQ
jgi:hypothetical protein